MLALALTEAYRLSHQEGKVNLRLMIVRTWQECGSLRETASKLHLSQHRLQMDETLPKGEAGLLDQDRRPHQSPRRTPPEVEEQVLALNQEKGWGRRRIAYALGIPAGIVGTKLWDHLRKRGLPRYQWTFLEGKTRFRFLAYSHSLSVVNGLCFVALVMSWLRAWGIDVEVDWQEDWGSEFGGENPEHLTKLDEQCYRPLGARLRRAPKGRKGY